MIEMRELVESKVVRMPPGTEIPRGFYYTLKKINSFLHLRAMESSPRKPS
jgi:hypothetical protein